jgi:hypothetical protein
MYGYQDQCHVHEFIGSTKFVGCGPECHNHRFVGVTGEAIPHKDTHIHKILTRTDYTDGHYHKICNFTGSAICVGMGKHVHFVCGKTSFEDGHLHGYQFATLIEDPTEKECKMDDDEYADDNEDDYEDECYDEGEYVPES